MLVIAIPSLAGVAILTCTYIMTICVRPNTLGPVDWYTAAWLQGLLAAVLALGASPLLNELGRGLTFVASLPAANLTLPSISFGDEPCGEQVSTVNSTLSSILSSALCLAHHARVGTVDVQLDASDISVQYEWWHLSAALAAGSSLFFFSHMLLSFLLLGICCSSPALWR